MPDAQASRAVELLSAHPVCAAACVVGQVVEGPRGSYPLAACLARLGSWTCSAASSCRGSARIDRNGLSFERQGESLRCEIRRDLDADVYEFVLMRSDGSERTERFDDPAP